MTREQAINNTIMCGNYLATYIADGLITIEIDPHTTRLHFNSPSMKANDIRAIADELGNLRLSGSDMQFFKNKESKTLTFTIYWEY